MGCTHALIHCDDGNACTLDSCVPESGCTFQPVDCDDQDLCTEDSCAPNSGCAHDNKSCDDGDECTNTLCEPASGCKFGEIDCDDENPCTVDGCDPVTGCVHLTVEEGMPCNDMEGWHCEQGECTCYASCEMKGCGDDGCGGSCGVCEPTEECDATLQGCLSAMVHVPPDTFWMGCNNWDGSSVNQECTGRDLPYHLAFLDEYWIDMTEATAGQYAACVAAGACSIPNTEWPECTWQKAGKEQHPINCVNWQQAKAFCAWAGKRLCTEAEWERGGRGSCSWYAEQGLDCKADSQRYPWGNEPPTCEVAVVSGCNGDGTHAVCSKSPLGDSPDELCDMAGNVWEWTQDWYQKDYYCDGDEASGDQYCSPDAEWPGSPAPWNNPQGPSSGVFISVRGGGVVGNGDYLSVSNRYFFSPDDAYIYRGLRCCRSE